MPPKRTPPDNPGGSADRFQRRENRDAVRESQEDAHDAAGGSAAAASSGNAAAISSGGDDDGVARRAEERARRAALLQHEVEEADADFNELVAKLSSLDDLFRNQLEEGRSLSDQAYARKMANVDKLHKEASDALQVWYEAHVDVNNIEDDLEILDAEHAKHFANINMLWEAISHSLNRARLENAPTYVRPPRSRTGSPSP